MTTNTHCCEQCRPTTMHSPGGEEYETIPIANPTCINDTCPCHNPTKHDCKWNPEHSAEECPEHLYEKMHNPTLATLRKVREERDNAIAALALMWNQYCGKDGHEFMTAGEAASDVLMHHGVLSGEYDECDNDLIDRILEAANDLSASSILDMHIARSKEMVE